MSRITIFYVLKSVTYLGLMGNSQNLQNQQNDIAVIHFCVLVTYTGERMYLTVNIKIIPSVLSTCNGLFTLGIAARVAPVLNAWSWEQQGQQ